MKVLTINGFSDSGKTTAVENIVKELRRRGYSVGTVKEICCLDFKMDTEGTDTDRHMKAGAALVTANAPTETDILYPERIPIDKILQHYDQDFCILEGGKDINAPKIITAHDTEGIDAKLDGRTLAITGVVAETMEEYKGYPVINCISDTARLVDLIEQKVPERMNDFDPDCCGACGLDCHTMLEMILSGEKTQEDCVIGQGVISLKIGGKPLPMVPFVQKVLHNTVLGIAKELHGYTKGAQIEISIGEPSDD